MYDCHKWVAEEYKHDHSLEHDLESLLSQRELNVEARNKGLAWEFSTKRFGSHWKLGINTKDSYFYNRKAYNCSLWGFWKEMPENAGWVDGLWKGHESHGGRITQIECYTSCLEDRYKEDTFVYAE